ncbi:hypothetical protein [Desulfobacter postgatei]|uniref:hypothetical protein n=1 Tax=Desulfobacter postgatei TaxID=2293 RepID=UPI00259B987A|nr:hypothetical protein [uncultured Desulfobacter sp.]
MSDNRYVKLSAYKENDPDKGEFGPLDPKYAWILAPLLRQCLEFSGRNPPRIISLSMNWQFYPESQARWARAWQESRLREKWAGLDVHTRYGKLTNMMSSFLVSDMKSMLSPLGLDVEGAYMEKMGWFRADALPFYSRILPLTDPSFQGPARRLLKAMLEITAPLAGKKICLGFNPEAYPLP